MGKEEKLHQFDILGEKNTITVINNNLKTPRAFTVGTVGCLGVGLLLYSLQSDLYYSSAKKLKSFSHNKELGKTIRSLLSLSCFAFMARKA
jgi:hypothetical protein